MYSFPNYCFELPDETHATGLSLFSIMSLVSSSFIVSNVLALAFLVQPLLALITLTSD